MSSHEHLENCSYHPSTTRRIHESRSMNYFKVDVYAFAVVTCEAFTREVPFRGFSLQKIFMRVVQKQKRPGEVPASAPESIRKIVSRAWQQNPTHRPHMDMINDALLAALAVTPPSGNGYGGGGGGSGGGASFPTSPSSQDAVSCVQIMCRAVLVAGKRLCCMVGWRGGE